MRMQSIATAFRSACWVSGVFCAIATGFLVSSPWLSVAVWLSTTSFAIIPACLIFQPPRKLGFAAAQAAVVVLLHCIYVPYWGRLWYGEHGPEDWRVFALWLTSGMNAFVPCWQAITMINRQAQPWRRANRRQPPRLV
jgi:hypothetical protein